MLCGLFGNAGKVLRDQAHGIDPLPIEFLTLTSGAPLVLSAKLERDREDYKLRSPCLTP